MNDNFAATLDAAILAVVTSRRDRDAATAAYLQAADARQAAHTAARRAEDRLADLLDERRRLMEAAEVEERGRRLADVMDSVVDGLRSMAREGRLEDMPDTEFEKLTDVLQDLYAAQRFAIKHARERFGFDRNLLHKAYFRRIERRTDDLGDIVESFRLGMNEDFGNFAVDAASRLAPQPAKGNTDSVSRETPICEPPKLKP